MQDARRGRRPPPAPPAEHTPTATATVVLTPLLTQTGQVLYGRDWQEGGSERISGEMAAPRGPCSEACLLQGQMKLRGEIEGWCMHTQLKTLCNHNRW